MIKCPNCQAEHSEHTLFCDKCGAYLSEGDQKGSDTLTVAGVTWIEGEETSDVSEGDVTAPLDLKLTILGTGRSVEVPFTKEVKIGRLDSANAIFPDVDLTGDGGLEKGISRRHAKITRRENEVFIEDLASINGTFLNRKKLIPYIPQALKSGDELQLGKLKLRVSFK